MLRSTVLAVCLLGGTTTALLAEEVTVKSVHLCCGSCEKAAAKALTGVGGVSDVKISRDDETVSFKAADAAAAKSGLTALANAGFYGSTTAAGPDFHVDPAARKNEVHITGLHLCCQGCTKAAEAAIKGVGGVKSVSTEAKKGTMTVDGADISLAATLKALHEAGFHGKVE